jgi:hypothetical protein
VIFHQHPVVSFPEVIHLVLRMCLVFDRTHLCEQLLSLMKQRNIFEISIRMNRYQFVISKESSKNTDVKPDINQLSANKRCQFLENIVIRGEISEQNQNGYCNVDFLLGWDPTNVSFFYDIMVLFSIVYLYVFLK